MKYSIFTALLIFFCFPVLVFAQTIQKIEVEGQKKIEADAIRNRIQTKTGQNLNSDQIRKDIINLFETGYFYDVQVEKFPVSGKGIRLVYRVTEKPSMVEINFKGNDEITDDELREIGNLKTYEIFDVSRVRDAVEQMEKLYEEKGYFLARVTYDTEPTDEGVKLNFKIQENDKVQVRKITILGASKISQQKIKSVMITQEGSFFSFLSGSGSYKQEAFDRDVQMINLLYYNEGYVQVKVDRPQVYVTPDKKSIYITLRVEEGDQYRVGRVDFSGDLLFSEEELFESTQIEDQGVFRYETLQKDLSALQAKYGDLGYAYANIIPRTRTRESDREMDITFEIDKGNKVYINEINMVGNTRTRDKVLRRELTILEGELYNETKKRESFDNIKRLGFFEEVNFNTKTPRGRNDLMDIDIVVKERNTGTIQAGAGYSSFYGFVLNGQVSQINFLGRGQSLSAQIDYSKRQSLFQFSFTEPYLWDTEWSAGTDLFQNQRSLPDYKEDKKGMALRFGHPLAPYFRGYLRYKLENTDLSVDPTKSDPDLFPVETANGTTSSSTFTLEYDKRDDRFAPTKGLYASTSLEYAGIGGSLNYTKGLTNLRYFKTLFWDVVWRNNINYGFVSSNDSNKDVPFNELFLLGGANSLRGYRWFSIGKRKFSRKIFDELRPSLSEDDAYNQALRPFGGTQQFFYNMELQFPLIKEAGILGVAFYDVGDANDELSVSDFRQNVGFGFRWFSPIGPLRFEWGFPLQRKQEFDEDAVNFEFAIGAPF